MSAAINVNGNHMKSVSKQVCKVELQLTEQANVN